jgi:hypothetical protein
MRMFDYYYIHPGLIFIPCLSMTPGGLRAQYSIPNLTLKCECLSIHSSLPFEPRHHAIPRNQRKQSLCRTETNCRPQAPLPNLLEKIFPRWAGFVTDSGPQISRSLVPIFGVNIFPFNYGIKVILFRNWLQTPTSSSKICSTPILPPCNPSGSPSRSKP